MLSGAGYYREAAEPHTSSSIPILYSSLSQIGPHENRRVVSITNAITMIYRVCQQRLVIRYFSSLMREQGCGSTVERVYRQRKNSTGRKRRSGIGSTQGNPCADPDLCGLIECFFERPHSSNNIHFRHGRFSPVEVSPGGPGEGQGQAGRWVFPVDQSTTDGINKETLVNFAPSLRDDQPSLFPPNCACETSILSARSSPKTVLGDSRGCECLQYWDLQYLGIERAKLCERCGLSLRVWGVVR